MFEARIAIADPVSRDLLRVDLERRGLTAQPGDASELIVRGSGSEAVLACREAVQRLGDAAGVAVSGLPAIDRAASPARPGTFAVVVAEPPGDGKWSVMRKRVQLQIERDAGRSVDRAGQSFVVSGIDSQAQAEQIAQAVKRGLAQKLSMPAAPAVVPDRCAPLVLAIEGDRRALVRQLGYAVDSAALVQIAVPDEATREQVAGDLALRGWAYARAEDRLLLGFINVETARQSIATLSLPADAAVQVTASGFRPRDLGTSRASRAGIADSWYVQLADWAMTPVDWSDWL